MMSEPFSFEWLDGGAYEPFKAFGNSFNMISASGWVGYSVSSPAPLSGREIRQILGTTSHINANVLHDRETSMRNQMRLELSKFRIKVSISNEDKFFKEAIKVKGPIPLKVAVALYAFDLLPVNEIVRYLRQKGINKDEYDLFSLCYQFEIPKMRHRTTFGEVIVKNPWAFAMLRELGLYEKAKTIFEANLGLGKTRALRIALEGVGIRT